MNETSIEVLKALGYPLSSVVVLVVLAYLARQVFQKLLESIITRDLEALKHQNAEALEQIRREHSIVLEDRRAELARETERLKSALSVQAETYRLAAQKRFEILLKLWQSSESLVKETDFSKADSIQSAMLKVDDALGDLNRSSVLLSSELLDHVRVYLEKTTTILTNSEKAIREGKIDPAKQKKLDGLVAAALPVASSVVGQEAAMITELAISIMPLLVTSVQRTLEKFRHKAANEARTSLESAIRQEFGVVSQGHAPPSVGQQES